MKHDAPGDNKEIHQGRDYKVKTLFKNKCLVTRKTHMKATVGQTSSYPHILTTVIIC